MLHNEKLESWEGRAHYLHKFAIIAYADVDNTMGVLRKENSKEFPYLLLQHFF